MNVNIGDNIQNNQHYNRKREELRNIEQSNLSQFNPSLSHHIFKSPILQNLREASLIISIIIGYHHQAYLKYLWDKDIECKTSAELFKQIRVLHKNPNSKLALRRLNRICLNVITDLDLNYSGPYKVKKTVKLLSQYFNCSINIFQHGGTSCYYNYPESYDIKMAEVNILLTTYEDIIHADYIRNIEKYLQEGGMTFCCLCVKVYNGKWHRCFAPRRCYACKRIKIYAEEHQTVFRTNMNFRNYCIRQMEKKCDQCETIYASKSCFKKHIRVKHCKEMVRCNSCQAVYRQRKNVIHECHATELCHVCFTSYIPGKRHYCKMEKQKPPSKYESAICCWDSESKVRSSPSYCNECFKKELNYLTSHKKTRSELKNDERILLLCDKHKEQNINNLSYHEVNFIGIFNLKKLFFQLFLLTLIKLYITPLDGAYIVLYIVVRLKCKHR